MNPDRLYIRESDRETYNQLLDRVSPFADKDNKHVFIMALIVGFREKRRVKLDKRFGFIRSEYLSREEESIIKAIAVAEKEDLDILLDKKKVYSIAEEYAAGGIRLLKEEVTSSYGSYIKRLESDLLDDFKKIDKT